MSQLPSDPLAVWPQLESLADYAAFKAEHAARIDQAWRHGQAVCAEASQVGQLSGLCGVCQTETTFDAPAQASGELNLRESLVCKQCHLNARMRAVYALLLEHCPPSTNATLYLTEQRSWFYQHVRRQWPTVMGSEYYGTQGGPRWSAQLRHALTHRDWLRHQDITALTFADQSVDAAVSCDVLEHVPNYQRGISELARVLKPGGTLLLTVPFRSEHAETRVRARIDATGQIEHLMSPEYHGDPLDPQGVLAFYEFGWDLLDVVRAAGFSRATWCLPWAPRQGLFWGLWTLVARR